jgi:hypothetical protein
MFSTVFYAASTLSLVSSYVVTPREGTTVLIGNDDGWAEGNVRAFYSTVKESGWNVSLLLSYH